MRKERTEEEIRLYLKQLRKEKGLRQKDLAKVLGYANASRISEYEKGATKGLFDYVDLFCKKMGIDKETILYYDDENTQVIVNISKAVHRYKVPNIGISLAIGIFVLITILIHVISTIVINERLKMWNIGLSFISLCVILVLSIVQGKTSDNYVENEVEDLQNISYISTNKGIKHPVVRFFLKHIALIIGMLFVVAFFCVIRQEVSIILIFLMLVFFETFVIVFGYGVYKNKTKKQGFTVYIFELIVLMIELILCSLITFGLQISNVSSLTYICLSFNELMIIGFYLSMIDCNVYLKRRIIVSEKRKKKDIISE